MKTLNLLLFFVLLAHWACSQNSQERQVSNFRGLNVSGNFSVYLTADSQESLRLEGDADVLEYVRVEVLGGILNISKDKKANQSKSKQVKVYVQYKNMSEITASASANVYANSLIEVEKLSLDASSAADINLEINVQEIRCNASSGADIKLKGKSQKAEIDASSGADIKAYELETQEAQIQASSGADVDISVSQSIDADASSGADISYKGSPSKVKVRSSSGGDVRNKKDN